MSKFGQKFSKRDGHISLLITWLKLFEWRLLEEGESSREVSAMVVLVSFNMSAFSCMWRVEASIIEVTQTRGHTWVLSSPEGAIVIGKHVMHAC